MPVLTNIRHELFAQAVAKGADLVAAYEQAGFKRHEGNASRLRADERVAERIDEILRTAALTTGMTVQELAQHLASIVRFDLADVIDWGMEKKPVGRRKGRPPNAPVDLSFVRLRNAADIAPPTRQAISKVRKTRYGVEIAAYNRLDAIRLLGQHLGMFKDDKDKDSGADALMEMIVAAHKKSRGDDARVIEGDPQ